ncbi:MAG: WbuC family cupin fold metalloprotein [Lachnospiraceae bacterium]|nr:WbuC family cupin fold metalloprotein [Lachnospiraceae bacterium]
MENSRYRPTGKNYVHVNESRKLKIDKKYIDSLKLLALEDSTGKCKMCLHNDIREHVHEMLNIFPKGSYVRPHMHPFKTETQNIIEGKMLMVLFDDIGNILDKFVMEKEGVFTFRLDKGIVHTNIPLSDVVVYEVTAGPFMGKDDSVFMQWAPEPNDETGVREIMDRIMK